MAGLMGAVPPIFKQRETPFFRNELSKTRDYKRFRTLRTGAAVEVSGERRHQEPARRAAHARRFDSELLSCPLEKGKSRRRRLSRSLRCGGPPLSGRYPALPGGRYSGA